MNKLIDDRLIDGWIHRPKNVLINLAIARGLNPTGTKKEIALRIGRFEKYNFSEAMQQIDEKRKLQKETEKKRLKEKIENS